jgi:putative oxidoreductase
LSVIQFIDPVARVLVASLFAVSGVSKALDLSGTTAAIAERLPAALAPSLATPLALAAIFIEVAGALALGLGAKVRLAATALSAFTVIVTALFHAFWLLPEGVLRAGQLFQFMKNLAILGALLLFIAHGAGAWSIDGKGSRRARRRSPAS